MQGMSVSVLTFPLGLARLSGRLIGGLSAGRL